MVIWFPLRNVRSKCECAHTLRVGMVLVVRPYVHHIYIFITYVSEIEQHDWSVGVEYSSILHPNIPSLMLGMHILYVATDTVVSLI